MESGCWSLGLGSFGCSAVGAGLGLVVWGHAACQGHLLWGHSVTGWWLSPWGPARPVTGYGSQPSGTHVPSCRRREAPQWVPGLGVPTTSDGAGWDWEGWGTWQLSPRAGTTPGACLSPLPAAREVPLGTGPHTQPEEGALLGQLPRGAGPCPGSHPSSVPAARQSLTSHLGPPSWHPPSRVGGSEGYCMPEATVLVEGVQHPPTWPSHGVRGAVPMGLEWRAQGCSRGSGLRC